MPRHVAPVFYKRVQLSFALVGANRGVDRAHCETSAMRRQALVCMIFAAILVAAAAIALWTLWSGTESRSPIRISGDRVVAVQPSDTLLARVHVGDRVDVARMSVADGFDMATGTLARPVVYRLLDAAGRSYEVTLTRTLTPSNNELIVRRAVTTLATCASILVAVFLLVRRPGMISLTFAAYCAFTIPTAPLIVGLSALPDPTLRGLLQLAAVGLTLKIGSVAIVAFALQFPEPFPRRFGTLAVRAANVLLALVAIGSIVFDPLHVPASTAVFDALSVASIPAVLIIIIVRYLISDVGARRRLAWVLAGAVLSSAAAWSFFSGVANHAPLAWGLIANIAEDALPIAVAYAVLRHRVLDLGFVLNRTLVYAILTTTIVLAVSFIDWFVGRLLSESRLATVLEAGFTVGFGVLLNTLHERVGRIVERFLFRERYTAVRRLEDRIDALDYAESPATVDALLVHECSEILHLRSAALFRSAKDGGYVRTDSFGWNDCETSLGNDHLLVRMIRSKEQSLELQAAGLRDPGFPAGDARPDFAIPIVRRHRVLGFVLYGHRRGELALDPQERALLQRVATAAANAYDSIEAGEWRAEGRPEKTMPALAG